MDKNSEFTMLAYVKQYQNDDLCAKWSNNIPASELNDPDANLLTDSQEVGYIKRQFTFLPDSVTGVITTVMDGDYGEVYVTESSHPYDLQAIYHPLSYYVE